MEGEREADTGKEVEDLDEGVRLSDALGAGQGACAKAEDAVTGEVESVSGLVGTGV